MTSRDDMRSYAKFRVTCVCGKRQPRTATAWSAEVWMRRHEQEHRDSGTPASAPTTSEGQTP